MKKNIQKIILMFVLIALPVVSFAQQDLNASECSNTFNTLGDVLAWGTCLLSNAIVPLLFAIALVIFIWGVIKFMKNSDSKEKEEGRNFMIWGVVALFVMVSVWGLVNVLNVTFGVRNVIPQLPSPSN